MLMPCSDRVVGLGGRSCSTCSLRSAHSLRSRGTLCALLSVVLPLAGTLAPPSATAQPPEGEDPARVEVPPPPPAGQPAITQPAPPAPPTALPPPPVVQSPGAPTAWVTPRLAPRPAPELLPAPMPFMLGFGFAVLGGFGVAGTTAVLVEASSTDRDLVLAATLSYLFSAAFSGVGLVLMVGSVIGEVKLYSHQSGWAWTAAVFSALGGLGAIAAATSWLVDGDFGVDSIGYTLAAAGCYGLTLLVFLGLDEADDPATRVGFAPAPGGGTLHVSGIF